MSNSKGIDCDRHSYASYSPPETKPTAPRRKKRCFQNDLGASSGQRAARGDEVSGRMREPLSSGLLGRETLFHVKHWREKGKAFALPQIFRLLSWSNSSSCSSSPSAYGSPGRRGDLAVEDSVACGDRSVSREVVNKLSKLPCNGRIRA